MERITIRFLLAGAMVSGGLVAGLHPHEAASLTPTSQPGATSTLSFPADHCVGNLSLEPESGPEWAPENVLLRGEWDHLGPARGDVDVPAARNVKLQVRLALNPAESARLLAQSPRAYQKLVANRIRTDPNDLTGLSALGPSDVYWLWVDSAMSGRTGVDPLILEPVRRLTGLRILTLYSTGVTDEGIEPLKSLRSLKGLELTESSITNQSLAVLKDLPELEYLYLDTAVTDGGLEEVAQVSSLRWLRVRGPRIWGPGLAELAYLPRLERLCIMSFPQFSNRHLTYLEGLTQLKGLSLWGAGDAFTDAGLASISKLNNLEELYFIRSSPKFTPAGIAHLKALKNLKVIDFGQAWTGPRGVHFGDRVVRQLAGLPNLESIRRIEYLSYNGMKTLTRFPKLRCLHVSLKDRRQGYRGRTGLSHLAALTSFEELAISSGDTLSESDLASLESLSNLKKLLIACEGVPDGGLASIGKLKQLECLELLCHVTRSGLNHLNGLANLRTLSVAAWEPDARGPGADELTLDLSGLKMVKALNLSGIPMQSDDLAFLRHLPLLENLMIQPDSEPSLTGASLRHLRGLPELNRLRVFGLASCTGQDLACLNGLPKLRNLRLEGDITNAALVSLTGPSCLESLTVGSRDAIGRETVSALTASHPALEYIHINELMEIGGPQRVRVRGSDGPGRSASPRPNDPRRRSRTR